MISSKGWRSRGSVCAGLLWLILSGNSCLASDSLRLAVAANFKPVLEQLTAAFESGESVKLDISVGSTGALYAQIRNGAPFDIFFAADAERPARLEAAGLTRARQAYALGRLVLWHPGQTNIEISTAFLSGTRIAIANPRHAPYGRAAMEVLRARGVSSPDLVYGSNVAQAFAFVATGNSPAGFVALSQVLQDRQQPSEYWLVPTTDHTEIRQELVVMRTAPPTADKFLRYLNTPPARRLIEQAGYELPVPLCDRS